MSTSETRIEITSESTNSFEVWQDGRTSGPLCLGEMLEQVIKLLQPTIGRPFSMHTPEQWKLMAEKRAAFLADLRKGSGNE